MSINGRLNSKIFIDLYYIPKSKPLDFLYARHLTDVLWYGAVRLSVRPSVRTSVRT